VNNLHSHSNLVDIMVRARVDRAQALSLLWARLTGTSPAPRG
jgi:hypothetical protein